MNTSRALISTWASLTDDFRRDHLKLCFLWYDEILFETIGTYDERRLFEGLVKNEADTGNTIRSLADVILPLAARVGEEITGDLLILQR